MTFQELFKGHFFSVPEQPHCLFVKIDPVSILQMDRSVKNKNAVLVSGCYQQGTYLDMVGDLVDFADNQVVVRGRQL